MSKYIIIQKKDNNIMIKIKLKDNQALLSYTNHFKKCVNVRFRQLLIHEYKI